MYPVVTKKVGYYLIQLSEGRSGWVQTKSAYRRVKEKEGNLIVVDDYVPVYNELSLEGEVIEISKKGALIRFVIEPIVTIKYDFLKGLKGGFMRGNHPLLGWI